MISQPSPASEPQEAGFCLILKFGSHTIKSKSLGVYTLYFHNAAQEMFVDEQG